MSDSMILIRYITPELKQEVKEHFVDWVRSSDGRRAILGLDVWTTFKMSNDGYVDVHFIYDEELTLYLYPCDEIREKDQDELTVAYLASSCTQYIPIEGAELNDLLPLSVIEYVKERASEVIS